MWVHVRSKYTRVQPLSLPLGAGFVLRPRDPHLSKKQGFYEVSRSVLRPPIAVTQIETFLSESVVEKTWNFMHGRIFS